MKNETKGHKEKGYKEKGHKENVHWIKTLGEILYNCPYLIAMVITSLVMVIYSDEIGIKAIAREAEELMRQTTEMGVFAEELSSETETVVENKESLEKKENPGKMGNFLNADKYDLAEVENAGESRIINNEIENSTEYINDSYDIDANEKNDEKREEIVSGVTRFEFYEPQITDSYYYSDAGKIALTTEYPYTKEDIGYFNDAIFIGDSRTLGIFDYAGLDEADFYCDNGMTILKLLDAEGVKNQKTGRKEDLNRVLQQNHYGKIYIMLGMNDLGYGNTDMYLERYRNIVNQFKEWQPNAIIYIMANLHVSREKNNPETEFNNININDKNAASASLANGIDVFYLDANPLFTDSEGFLNAELSFDGVHLYAQHYDAWREFLLEHAVEPENAIRNTDASDIESVNSVVSGMQKKEDFTTDEAQDDTES